ncbi:MAG TPA: DNA gyrase inhibitor YacG [Novosphingobium sp.]|nr:DNA gyrase inhibitor YacG [Novosphingobium sp.]
MTTTRKCPICGKPRSTEHTPFCGTRCRDRDLVKWLVDGYALPGLPVERKDEGGEDGDS